MFRGHDLSSGINSCFLVVECGCVNAGQIVTGVPHCCLRAGLEPETHGAFQSHPQETDCQIATALAGVKARMRGLKAERKRHLIPSECPASLLLPESFDLLLFPLLVGTSIYLFIPLRESSLSSPCLNDPSLSIGGKASRSPYDHTALQSLLNSLTATKSSRARTCPVFPGSSVPWFL